MCPRWLVIQVVIQNWRAKLYALLCPANTEQVVEPLSYMIVLQCDGARLFKDLIPVTDFVKCLPHKGLADGLVLT